MARLSKDHRAPRGIARLMGHDHLSAMVFAKIAAWAKVAKKKELGVTKTDAEWCRDLEVTPKQLRRVKNRLLNLGLIERARAPWGRRPNAVFLKPTQLGLTLLATPPKWAPASSPNGPKHLCLKGPNGTEEYHLYCPNGPFLNTIKTSSKKNQIKEKTGTGGHAFAWSAIPDKKLYELVSEEDVVGKRPIEIDTVPKLIAYWDYWYCSNNETDISPRWLPGHLGVIDELLKEKADEWFEIYKEIENEQESEWNESPEKKVSESDEEIAVKPPPKTQEELFAVSVADAEREVCQRLARIICWTIRYWCDFVAFLEEEAGTKDIPDMPEIEFLLYYLALAHPWAVNTDWEMLTEEDDKQDCLYIIGTNLDGVEAEFHDVAKKHQPGYVPVPWTDDQRIEIHNYAHMSGELAVFAARRWRMWCEHKYPNAEPKPFSTNAMIQDFEEIVGWACTLWEPGEIPHPTSKNDYWPPNSWE